MTRFRPLRFARALLVLVFASSLLGCFEYKEEITINDDGSGTVKISGWIDGNITAPLYEGEEERMMPPPVGQGLAERLIVGSRKVTLTDYSMYSEGQKWVFEATIEFADLEELAKTKYFKQRKPSLTMVAAKELRYRSTIGRNLVDMAIDRSEIDKDNKYAAGFAAAMNTENFKNQVLGGKMTYSVAFKGTDATGTTDFVDAPAPNTVRGRWEFSVPDLLDAEEPARMELVSKLPPERGFTEVVMIVLVLSVIGILVPAVRLVILKIKGVS